MADDRLGLRDELRDLTAAVRAFVEWHEDCGAEGLVTTEDPGAVLAALAARPPARGRGGRPTAQAGRPPQGGPPQRAPAHAGPPPAVARSGATQGPQAEEGGRAGAPLPAAAAAEPRPAPAAARPPRAPERSQEPPEERRARLALLAEEVRACTRCRLHAQRTQTVFARGNPLAELCFIGEGPGADEDAQGFPFVGRAGQLLDKMIVAMGYARDDVYVCNIVKCRPPENRKPEPDEMAACTPYLVSQLELVSPRAIVALGATAVQGLLGTTEGITRMRGKWKLYKGSIPIMPTFHPAYLLRQPNAKREVWSDLQEVMKVLGKPLR